MCTYNVFPESSYVDAQDLRTCSDTSVEIQLLQPRKLETIGIHNSNDSLESDRLSSCNTNTTLLLLRNNNIYIKRNTWAVTTYQNRK